MRLPGTVSPGHIGTVVPKTSVAQPDEFAAVAAPLVLLMQGHLLSPASVYDTRFNKRHQNASWLPFLMTAITHRKHTSGWQKAVESGTQRATRAARGSSGVRSLCITGLRRGGWYRTSVAATRRHRTPQTWLLAGSVAGPVARRR
jgi:hypothetical protein